MSKDPVGCMMQLTGLINMYTDTRACLSLGGGVM